MPPPRRTQPRRPSNQPQTRPPAVLARGLVKHFGPVKAVDGVDLEVRPGECFGLLGRNGAGKSTIIKMLIGLLPPDAGSVQVDGHDLARDAQALRACIGYVPQSLSADAVFTGRENLDLFGRFYGLTAAQRRQRVPETLAMLGLEASADRRAGTYSGGMLRLLEIGQSILHRPPVVILDEPTIGLDPVGREALWKHLRGLQKAYGMAVLLTTHYMDEAELLCARMAILRSGKVVALGSLAELRRQSGLKRANLEKIFMQCVGRAEAA